MPTTWKRDVPTCWHGNVNNVCSVSNKPVSAAPISTLRIRQQNNRVDPLKVIQRSAGCMLSDLLHPIVAAFRAWSVFITLDTSSGKRKASVLCPSVRYSVQSDIQDGSKK